MKYYSSLEIKHIFLLSLALSSSAIVAMQKPVISKDSVKYLDDRETQLLNTKEPIEFQFLKEATKDKNWLEESYWSLLPSDLQKYIIEERLNPQKELEKISGLIQQIYDDAEQLNTLICQNLIDQFKEKLKTINPNVRDEDDWATPLHTAAEQGKEQFIEPLIKAGADVNSKDDEGFTPLHLAFRYNHPQIIKKLLQNGACLNAKNEKGYTPLGLVHDDDANWNPLELVQNEDETWSLYRSAQFPRDPLMPTMATQLEEICQELKSMNIKIVENEDDEQKT